MATDQIAVLRVRDLTVSLRPTGARRHRPHTPVLSGLTFDVARGECLAIVGESGAGKSVLARSLLGLTQADPAWQVSAHSFAVTGNDMATATQRRWRAMRGSSIALVLQDALQSLDPLRTIEAEVGEALAVHRAPRAQRRARVIAALAAAGLDRPQERLGQRSTELSGGMRQRALIASAIASDPQLLIADEPTTALDPTTAATVLSLFGEARDHGTGIVLISHDLRAVAQVADRIAVLDHGRIVEIGSAEAVLGAPTHAVTRALVAAIPSGAKPHLAATDAGQTFDAAPTLLRVDEVTRSFGHRDGARWRSGTAEGGAGAAAGADKHAGTRAGTGTGSDPHADTSTDAPRVVGVDRVSLVLRRGEALGIVGESGAGKSTLARLIVGAEQPNAGTITRLDENCVVRLIPQDPWATFDPRWRVERILASAIAQAARARTKSPGSAAADSQPRHTPGSLLAAVGLDEALLARRPATLSGGQRQRVAIARALAADPDVLVCDEPVSALDVSTQAGILELLRTLQLARGLALIFVSHDLAAVRTVCDNIMVMQSGRVIEAGPTEKIFASPTHAFTRALIVHSESRA